MPFGAARFVRKKINIHWRKIKKNLGYIIIDQMISDFSSPAPPANTLPFWEKNKIIFHLYLTCTTNYLKYLAPQESRFSHLMRTEQAKVKNGKSAASQCGDQKGYSKHEPINFTKKTSHFTITITTYYYLQSTAKSFFWRCSFGSYFYSSIVRHSRFLKFPLFYLPNNEIQSIKIQNIIYDYEFSRSFIR